LTENNPQSLCGGGAILAVDAVGNVNTFSAPCTPELDPDGNPYLDGDGNPLLVSVLAGVNSMAFFYTPDGPRLLVSGGPLYNSNDRAWETGIVAVDPAGNVTPFMFDPTMPLWVSMNADVPDTTFSNGSSVLYLLEQGGAIATMRFGASTPTLLT